MLYNYQVGISKTWKEYPEFTLQELRMLDWSLGLAGECGEVTDIVKHAVLHRENLDKMELAKEMGDVLWYLTALAETVGIEMEDILCLNKAKLDHRYEGHYSAEASASRHEKETDFKSTSTYKEIESRILYGKQRTEDQTPRELVETEETKQIEEMQQRWLQHWERMAESSAPAQNQPTNTGTKEANSDVK